MGAENTEIPGYEIKKRLGRGGMATVYLAEQQPINRNVALKIMSNQLGDDSVWAKRFIQEAQVIAQLSHPNIVPVFDVGTHDGHFYISMELLENGSLKDKMSTGIPIPEVLKIIVGVAAGLDFAGEKGFVHRDIKPDNIMFRSDGSPVILDFGIVKQMDEGPNKMTQTGVIVGTTSYMSPEQAQGRELDQRSDIYALGVMFYELLTGKPPYKGDTDVATLLMHINEPIPKLPQTLSVFQSIIDKALSKDPFHRYTRAREMIDHLERIEPEIKAALLKLKVGNTSDPTVVKTKVVEHDDDATMVMGSEGVTGQHTGQHTGPVTTEEELTKVLSSAKATIRDFSAESRERRARRTKQLIMSVSLVAACAVGYVGYQQLYVVPKERAAAEERIRAAALKTENKIKELLAEAKTERQGLVPADFDKVDSVIAIYRQVLKLDPENQEAQFTLDKLGERYIEMSKGAIRRRDLNKAVSYRDYAEQLAPSSEELPALRKAIKQLRAEQIDREFVLEEIDNLLTLAKEDVARGNVFSDSAYTKLQQVLRLDSENLEAKELINKMLEDLYLQTEKDVSRGRVSRARSNISVLEKYYGNQEQVKALKDSLANTSSQLEKKQRIKNLLVQADRLQREKRSISINDELREIYLDVLGLERNNRKAKRGLNDVAKFEDEITRQAIKERDYDRASEEIKLIEKHTPRYAGLASLKKALSQARKNSTQADGMLNEAMDMINSSNSGDQRRKDLLSAYDKIQQAEQLDQNNPDVNDSMQKLESAYVTTISQLIASKKSDLVNSYFKDASGKRWPSDRILQLQIAQQNAKKKTKPKKVITGGF